MPGPKDIVIYWPGPREFSVVQKPWGWAHISVQKPRVAGGMVTGQIDTCIIRHTEYVMSKDVKFHIDITSQRHHLTHLPYISIC